VSEDQGFARKDVRLRERRNIGELHQKKVAQIIGIKRALFAAPLA
jgi:DNA-binding XRE family transcriptional regulator